MLIHRAPVKVGLILLFNLLYLFWFYVIVGLRPSHVLILFAMNLLYFAGEQYKRFFYAIVPIILYLSVYDSLRAFPNYMYNTLHIKSLYDLEKSLFGIEYHMTILTVNEYLSHFQHSVLDLISGISYLTWVPVPLAFALYLYFSGKKEIFINFTLLFVTTNFLGFAGYFLYPAAPPWYVEMCGFDYYPEVSGEATRLSNFDQLIGFPIFKTIYENNENVFAAVPSIHAANPFTCLIAGLALKNTWLTVFFSAITMGMWFGAVYSNHHYVFDVLGGICIVLIATAIVYGFLRRYPLTNDWLTNYRKII